MWNRKIPTQWYVRCYSDALCHSEGYLSNGSHRRLMEQEMTTMEIAEFQQWVKNTDRATQWNLLTALQLVSHLAEEVGELAQSINRVYGYAEEREKCLANLGNELVDVFWFLTKIANKFGVDLDVEVRNLVERASEWPIEAIDRHRSELVEGLRTLNKEVSVARNDLCLEDETGDDLPAWEAHQ